MNRTIPRKVYVLPKSLNTKDWPFQKFHRAHLIPKPFDIAAHKIQCSVSHLDWECCRQMMRAGVVTATRPHPKGLFVKMCTSKKHTKLFSSSFYEKGQVGLSKLAFCWFCPLPNLEGLVWDPGKIPSQPSLWWILPSSSWTAFRVTCNCNENSYSHLLEILV